MNIEFQYEELKDSIRLLSFDYKKQKKALPDFVVVQDEVIMSFEDSFLLLPQFIEKGLLTFKSIASLIRCYNFMNLAFRNQQDFTDFKKNKNSWAKVRELAAITIRELDDTPAVP